MPETSTARARLDSWKEIAAYIGRDIRTAMRWEKERGLPVHRVPGDGARQPVFAYKDELDEWLEQKEGPTANERLTESAGLSVSAPLPETTDEKNKDGHSGHKGAFFLGMIGLALIVGVSIAILRHRTVASGTALVVRIQFAANAIHAYDDADHVLWTHVFPKLIHPEALKHPEFSENLVRIADLYGDGRREALVTVPLEQSADPRATSLNEIDCFSNDGKPLWSYIPNEKFQFGSFEANGPWMIEDVFVSEGQKPAIWAAMTTGWGDSFVVQLDSSTGKDTVRFVNTGIIYKLNETAISGKRYLLIGGFNNEYAAGILAVMDEAKTYAVSPQTAGTRHKCVSCGKGSSDYYFVFPRSEINQLYKAWEDSVHFINIHGNIIEVGKSALGDAALGAARDASKVYVFYDFKTVPEFRPAAFRFDSWYDMTHQDFQKKGMLDHGIEFCPERLHPAPVRLWTPNAGWSEISLAQTTP